MGANTRYKDSVFSFLFSNPDTLRELYGAITGIELPPDAAVTINTLEDVLYKSLLNDISFEVDHKLVVLVEHQSTVNPNMAIRLLMYIARIYEKITSGRNMYGSKKLFVPRPEFIVLYNGKAPYPDEAVLNLSEGFEGTEDLGIPDNGVPALELTVKVYNINRGHNEGIIRRSETLKGYSEFIAKVRELEALNREREDAMEGAIRWCIANNILRVFFESHGTEVINMLMTEWKLEEALVVEREEGREEGWEKGREEGREKGREEGLGESVKNLLDFGMSPEQISRALKLPLDVVQRCLTPVLP
ncbi:MAG: Rpn family recombination-promoting nuclease/putative transposase [Spirochaetaceae bacterium]|jgi:hypothetical protein|nr:Rpn family recombination-promoting nuclease/putative transposase [Spirochaetaceae bacterium]